MPTTRSQSAEEKTMRVYEDYPASPSENAPASAITVEPRSTEPTTSRRPDTELTMPGLRQPQTAITASGRTRAPSIRSNHSTASAIARMRQAELAAEEQLAEIKRQELQIQATLIKKRLAADVALIRDETDRESLGAEEAEAERRVSDWLQRTQIRGERPTERQRSPHLEPRDASRERQPLTTPSRVTFDRNQRQTSPTPARSKERGIERLADTLEKIARNRAPPRQTQDLPIFTGAPGEWLPFKAAMRESTHIHGFSPAENLARLRACLRGEAKQVVSALLYTASEPTTIMRTLEQCYGRPEMIIDSALEDIKRLPRLGTSAGELNNFAIKLQNIVTIITCLDEKGYLQNPMLIRHVTEKLSPHVRARWCDYAEEFGERNEPEIVTLSKFLMREADRAVRHSYAGTTMPPIQRDPGGGRQQRSRYNDNRRGTPVYATVEETKERLITCHCCGAEHETPKCKKLLTMTVPERWEWVKEARICFLCLNSKHRRFRCRAKQCGLNECRRPHHALLHMTREVENRPKEEAAITASTHTTVDKQKILLKICPIVIKGRNNDKEMRTYALLDEGSTISLVDEEVAAWIGADGPTRPLNIHGVTSSQREPNSRAIDILIKGRAGQEYHPVRARTVRNLTLGEHTIDATALSHRHLRNLTSDEVCYRGVKPRVLIGADQWPLIVTRKLRTGKRNQPAASLTRLGWVIHGSTPRSVIAEKDANGAAILHVRASQNYENTKDDELTDLVRAHFDIDALGIRKTREPGTKEKRAVEIMERTAKRVNNRFEVGLPWDKDDARLPPSYDMALRRLGGIERKMDRSPGFERAYTNQVERLLEKGYATESQTGRENNDRLWYLPHFATTNPHKPDKPRMVFDAAARANGACLNDALLDGPDLLQNLHGVLFRFRMKPVAVTSDIREMFLQIKIREEDQPAQHFLWRGRDRTNPPKAFKMTSMIFGARSSPFLAHSIRNRNASEYKDSHPLAYEAITQNHYMDDWVQSYDTEEEATQAIGEVIEVHKKASFELAGWSSNVSSILQNIREGDKASSPKELGTNVNPYSKTLGIRWLAKTDELAFNTEMPRVPGEIKTRLRTPTKREALGAVMSIFDPLGLLSPFTITAKIILQGLWRQKMNWDDPLPPEAAEAFNEWLGDLKHIKDIRLPRCYDTKGSVAEEIHVFCDASEQAYSTAAYWRFREADGRIRTILIAGKAKVAPLKTQSIPRLELQACLIGARLAAEIIKEHKTTARVTLWSDSKTALLWIKNEPAKYTPYVAHRLSEICELTRPEQWRWVPTAMNVADDATRPGNTRLRESDRWFTGPTFLSQSHETWPRGDDIQAEHEETVAHQQEAEARPELIKMDRFSSYEKIVRAMGYVHLFIQRCRRQKGRLNVEILKKAEYTLIKEAQEESFPDELQRLRQGKPVDRHSRLYKLDPVYDGLIKLNGRINATTVPEAMKEPPLLDGSHPLTKMLIRREHEKHSHVGREQIVNSLRQRYWILRLRPAVRSVIRSCAQCKLRRAVPPKPVKGNLPKSRLNDHARPFSHCGVDCFGPMWVTIGRRREKRWGMIFTCMTTRAIHIELLATLGTDSALMAMRRMAARRGWPERMLSDNGTNFHGAEAELRKAYEEWLPELVNYALTQRTEWKFIDPGAPNQGGAWERLIRSIKTAMAVTLKEKTPREETLATLLTEIEHTINSRPLTHVPVNPDDAEALTPNHFLLGTATGLPFVGSGAAADHKTWRAAQSLANVFWARWIKEYWPTLTPRNDARKTPYKIEKGDLVIIADGLLPRNVWPKGRVEKTHVGPDGVVRSAEVRTRGGIFRRPVRRLIVLPIPDGCEDLRRGETVTDDGAEAFDVAQYSLDAQ